MSQSNYKYIIPNNEPAITTTTEFTVTCKLKNKNIEKSGTAKIIFIYPTYVGLSAAEDIDTLGNSYKNFTNRVVGSLNDFKVYDDTLSFSSIQLTSTEDSYIWIVTPWNDLKSIGLNPEFNPPVGVSLIGNQGGLNYYRSNTQVEKNKTLPYYFKKK